MSHVVCLGGGTGTFTVLSGLKKHGLKLSAVVSIADNGGSTGILRDELGVLPPGDIRQCLVALAGEDQLMRKLFMYRFHEGMLSGHSFGNIFLSALEKVTGDPLSAIEAAHKILDVDGQIIPVSSVAANLFAELSDGIVLEGEKVVDKRDPERSPIARCFLSPPVQANPRALEAIREADVLVLGPGDLFTSLIPVLLVQGVREAVSERRAHTLLVLNLVTRPGQVDSPLASSFLEIVNQYLSPGAVTDVIVNSRKPHPDLIMDYAKVGDVFIEDDLSDAFGPVIHRADCLSDKRVENTAGDKLTRSLIRHDPEKLAKAILEACLADR